MGGGEGDGILEKEWVNEMNEKKRKEKKEKEKRKKEKKKKS